MSYRSAARFVAEYTVIVPRADCAGPCNVAVDLCHQALASGFRVRLLYLSGAVERDDVTDLHEVRQFRWRDLLHLHGIVHTHCLRPDLVGALFTFRQHCRVITTIHNYFLVDNGLDHGPWKTRLAYEIWSRCISRFDARVTISRAMNRYYRRLLPETDFQTAYNFRHLSETPVGQAGSDLQRFVDEQRAAGRVVMAFIGVLSRRKNVVPLAKAVIAAERLALVVCGSGPLDTMLASLASEASASKVYLAGHRRDPRPALRACDMLVLPSLAEGMPLVVIEALACGRPALLSNIAVHRELARLGVGATFDHKRFSNLEEQAIVLAARRDAPELQQLYARQFSPRQGFARYLDVFAACAPEWFLPNPLGSAAGASNAASKH